MLKLRRPRWNSEAEEIGTAGCWETVDGRFRIFRELETIREQVKPRQPYMLMVVGRTKPVGRKRIWRVTAASQLLFDTETLEIIPNFDTETLTKTGLLQACFPSRKAAVEALEAAFYENA